jgi:NitT/TauT family transport system substrate-binding protein
MTIKSTLAAVAVLMGLSVSPSLALEKLVLAHAAPQLSPSYAINSSLPQYLKYWEEEGLEVEIIPTPGAAAAMQLVISGQADVAMGSANAAFAAIQRGAPLKIYFSTLRGDIFGVALPEGSGLTSLEDLKGKTVGVSSFASAGAPYLKGLLKSVDLTDQDVSIVEIGLGGRAAGALQSGQVDALALWDEAYVQMEENGIKFSKIITDPRAAYAFSSSLVVRVDNLEKRRKEMVGLARGIAKAQLFESANLEAAARIHWDVFPQSAPREGVTPEAAAEMVKVLEVRQEIQGRDAFGTGKFGDLPPEYMAKFQDFLVETDQLEKKIDPTQYYTNDLIDDINSFDVGAVIEAAKTFTLP